ncbi:MAG: putative lipid II flippase FtsW, partial [Candidatus Marinimicrobia bacterium]|nr:putative lipid II flippase FtsW [Candidatus Neomarinimicrobiota bacterium]
ATRFDNRLWGKGATVLWIGRALLLIITLIPSVGTLVKGSRRWLRIGPFGFQPSEIAKFALVVILARYLARHRRRAETLVRGTLIPLVLIGLLAGPVFLAPDFGSTMLLGLVGLLILFLGGSHPGYLSIVATGGLGAFALAIARDEVRWRRTMAFLNPEKYAQQEAYQLIQARYAFVLGGGLGVGLGQSLQKQFYLPEAHTDFIYAIIGEEFGLWGTGGVLLLFGVLVACGLHISYRAPDPFGRLLAAGLTLMIGIQALLNIAVVTGCLPTKGLPLPFISYGGTHLVMSLFMIGVLINIAQAGARAPDRIAGQDRLHDF